MVLVERVGDISAVYLPDEAGRRVAAGAAVAHSAVGEGYPDLAFCSGQRDVEKTALFLEVFG